MPSRKTEQTADLLHSAAIRLLRYVRKVSSPYNVNGIALECLPAALEDEGDRKSNVDTGPGTAGQISVQELGAGTPAGMTFEPLGIR